MQDLQAMLPLVVAVARMHKCSSLCSFNLLGAYIGRSCSAAAAEMGWDSVFPVSLLGTACDGCLLSPSDTYLPLWLSGGMQEATAFVHH